MYDFTNRCELILIVVIGFVAIAAGCSSEPERSNARGTLASCADDVALVWATGAAGEHQPDVLDVGCVSSSGKREGPAVRIADGRAISFSNFSGGAQDGPSVILNPDGGLEALTISEHGLPRRAYFWNSEGWIQHSAELDAPAASTTHTYWYSNGFMKNRFTTTRPDGSSPPSDAILNGKFFAWHEDGTLLATGSYLSGKKTGAWRCRTNPSSAEISLDFSSSRLSAADALDSCVASLFRQNQDMSVAILDRR